MLILSRESIINHFSLTAWGTGDNPNYAVETDADYIRAGVYFHPEDYCYKPYLKLKSGKSQQLNWLQKESGWLWSELKLIASALSTSSTLDKDTECSFDGEFIACGNLDGILFYSTDSATVGNVNTGSDGTYALLPTPVLRETA